jgi:AcrR family transcriptional regulator
MSEMGDGAATAPRGRDAVRAAVIAAAEALFAERGYSAVSVRDLAAAAGVNHGLIHRHFGSKDGVLQAVLQGMFSDVGAAARTRLDLAADDYLERLFPLVSARKRHWQILMRAVMDGFDFTQPGFEFPITRTVVEHVAAVRGVDDRETRVVAGHAISAGLGWLLLETYLAPVLGLEDADVEDLRHRMAAFAEQAVQASRTSS